jgi:hypothetical protein
MLLQPAGATSTLQRNSLDFPGGGPDRLTITSAGGATRGDEVIDLTTDDGAYSVTRTWRPADYLGPTGPTYIKYGDDIFDIQRVMRSEAWGGGLLRHPLYKMVDGAWTQSTLGQAFEYVDSALSPGQEYRLFMVSGPRSSNFPLTGSARFVGDAFGTYQGPGMTSGQRARGEMRMDVDFGRREIRGALTRLFYAPVQSGFAGDVFYIGDIPFTAPLSSSFVATATPDRSSDVPLAGTVSGEFFGDVGAGSTEVGGVFALQSPQASLSGVYLAGRNRLEGIYATPTAQTFTEGGANFVQTLGPDSNINFTWTRTGPGAAQRNAILNVTRGAIVKSVTYIGQSQADNNTMFLSPTTPGQDFLYIVERVSGRDLNYAGLGNWHDFSSSSAVDGFFVFGQRTTDMPTTGSASYAGVSRSIYQTPTEQIPISGRLSMGANFATRAVSGTVMGNLSRDSFDFNAVITGSGFAGSFRTRDQAITGNVDGLFAGPRAAEVAGTFQSLTGPAGVTLRGGFVGMQ